MAPKGEPPLANPHIDLLDVKILPRLVILPLIVIFFEASLPVDVSLRQNLFDLLLNVDRGRGDADLVEVKMGLL